MKKLLYVMACFIFTLCMGVNVKAEEAGNPVQIESVTIGSVDASVQQYEGDSHIWLVQAGDSGTNISKTTQFEISGEVSEEVTEVECYDDLGNKLSIEREGTNLKIIKNKFMCWPSTRPLYGNRKGKDSYSFYINSHIGDAVIRDYVIVECTNTLNTNSSYLTGNILEKVELIGADDTSQNRYPIDFGIETDTTMIIEEHMNAVQLKLMRGWDNTYIERKGNLVKWLTNGDNYIVVNGDVDNKISVAASSEKYGEHESPIIPLKQGWNVISVNSPQVCYLASSSNTGFKMNAQYSYIVGAVYLVYSDGYKGEIEESSDVSLSTMDVYQLTTSIYGNSAEYTVTQSKEDPFVYSVDIPNEMPYDKTEIYLGVIPNDSNAEWEVIDPSPMDKFVEQYRVVDTKDREEIKIKVTAQDGTEATYTLKLNRVSFDACIESVSIEGGTLETGFASDTYSYKLKGIGEELQFTITCSENASVKVDGKSLEGEGDTYTFTIDPRRLSTVVAVTAENKTVTNTYTFSYADDETMWTIPESTKTLAKQMLEESGWYDRSDSEKNDLSAGYWSVFMAAATNLDTKDANVYDVTKHEMKQATDWAGCILELVLIGENPYNFNGVNYVEGLENCYSDGGYGPYACNIWALEAFKAVGHPVDESLITTVKNQAKNENFDLDMSSWALAAVNEYLTEDERYEIVNRIRNVQMTEGLVSDDEVGMFYNFYYNYANTQSHGCALSGLAEAGVNFEEFCRLGDITPLTVVRDKYMKAGEGFIYCLDTSLHLDYGYNKDIIIGLGDVMNGSNVWARLTLTDEKMDALKEQAITLLSSTSDDEIRKEISNALDVAVNVKKGDNDFGEKYFALYDAMAKEDSSLRKYAKMCATEEAEAIDSIIESIDKLGDVTIENKAEYNKIKEAYDALDSEVLQSYVSNWDVYEQRMEAFIAEINEKADAVAVLGDVDDLTLDSKAAVDEAFAMYDVLTREEKQEITNGSNLVKANNKMTALSVEEIIKNLPETVTLDNEKAVSDAVAAYQALTTAQKRFVLSEYVYKLNEANKTIQTLKGQPVTDITENGGASDENAVSAPKKVAWKKAVRKNARKVKLTWKKQACSGYQIWMKKSKNSKWKLVKVINSSRKHTYTKSGLKKKSASKYYFKIRAYNQSGNTIVYGKFSNVRKVK